MVSIPPSKDTGNILQDHSKKSICYWYNNRHIDQWNRTENPNMSTDNFSHLTFDKRTRKHKMKERKHLQQTVLGKLDIYI